MKQFKRKSTMGRILAYGALIAGALVVAAFVNCCFPMRVPSDQKLIATFQAHRGAFEQLHAMAAKDMQTGLYFSWYGGCCSPDSSKPPQLSASRWAEYTSLTSSIRPISAVIRDDGVMRFIFAGNRIGLAVGPGWSKGIEYIPPDKSPKTQGHDYVREIEPTWFIFYDRFDD
jgi:hypothetical protein